jgi:hypothetical protein
VSSAPTESVPAAPALGVAPPLAPTGRPVRRRPPAGSAASRRGGIWPATLVLAALLCLLTFYATGGLELESMTDTELGVTIGSGVLLAGAALTMRTSARAHGLGPALLLLAFALLSAVSIAWSVQPDASWRDAGRMLSYAAVFGAAVAIAKIAPRRWPAIPGAIVLSSVVICGYALLTKSLPDHFVEANKYARIYEPYGYWNALGLTAAMGAICCMWLGARRAGHALLSALAFPAMGLLLLTLLLAYSRGALVALAIGLVLWFCLVPLRLRGAVVLLCGGVCAGAVGAWDFSNHALSAEKVPIAEATSAGHELGALVLAMMIVLTAVGVAVSFLSARRPPTAALRQRAGTALIALLVLLVLAFAGALAHSHRGFTGTISHAFNTLTDTHAKVPNTPGRLTAVASVRAQYWDEALKVFKAHPALGAGASGYETARLRYRTGPLPVKHAHGYIVQTMADLGLLGLVLSLALLLAWLAAAGRATHPFNRRWSSWRELRESRRPAWRRLGAGEPSGYGPERIGLLSLVCVVAVFGVHSLIDWTWYVPGNAIVGLLCAGWLAGRGPLAAAATPVGAAPIRPFSRGPSGPGAVRIALAAAAIVGALLIAWTQWQPQRSEEARNAALAQLESNPRAALSSAHSAVSRDPLSVEALFVLAQVQAVEGQAAAARATLRQAVKLQPSNPQTWLTLGRYDLASDPGPALNELRAGIYLDPELISPEALTPAHPEAVQVYNDYVQALRATQAQTLRTASERRSRATGGARRAARRRHAPRSPGSRTPR